MLNTLRPIEQGQRDIYLLHLYSAAQMTGMSNEDALALARSANASFSCPLPEQEVARNLRSAAQKHYSFRTATIIAALAITPDEQTEIGLTVYPKYDSNRARKARNTAKKRRRRTGGKLAVTPSCHQGQRRNAVRHGPPEFLMRRPACEGAKSECIPKIVSGTRKARKTCNCAVLP